MIPRGFATSSHCKYGRARRLWIQDGLAWGQLRLSHDLEREALQILRLRNGGDHWMVRRLTVNRHTAKNAPGVKCRRQNHIPDGRCIEVVRAAKNRRAVAVLQPPCYAFVSLKKEAALAGGLNESTPADLVTTTKEQSGSAQNCQHDS